MFDLVPPALAAVTSGAITAVAATSAATTTAAATSADTTAVAATSAATTSVAVTVTSAATTAVATDNAAAAKKRGGASGVAPKAAKRGRKIANDGGEGLKTALAAGATATKTKT